MRRKWKLIWIALLVVMMGTVIAYRIAESPSRLLRHALHLPRLPASIHNLQMQSDLWADEVRRFQFDIAPHDFPALLTGRRFRVIGMGDDPQAGNRPATPPDTFDVRWMYDWDAGEARGSTCQISTNAEKNHVEVIFSAR